MPRWPPLTTFMPFTPPSSRPSSPGKTQGAACQDGPSRHHERLNHFSELRWFTVLHHFVCITFTPNLFKSFGCSVNTIGFSILHSFKMLRFHIFYISFEFNVFLKEKNDFILLPQGVSWARRAKWCNSWSRKCSPAHYASAPSFWLIRGCKRRMVGQPWFIQPSLHSRTPSMSLSLVLLSSTSVSWWFSSSLDFNTDTVSERSYFP